MYENVAYKRSPLKTVIARLDFVSPVAELDDAVPAAVTKAIAKTFPIAEPNEGVAHELRLGADRVQAESRRRKEWNFYGKNRQKRLLLASNCLFVETSQYVSFEAFEKDFALVVSAFEKTFADTVVSRFGLRFVNHVQLPSLEKDKVATLINPDLLQTLTFAADDAVKRSFSVLELGYEDLSVTFQSGFPNPDHPAVLKNPLFVIDMDAYVQSALSFAEVMQQMGVAHEKIQALFERSIRDPLREQFND